MPNKKKGHSLFALILAGGTGTRLWPRSRRESPKQLLALFSERTMLQETCDRILPIVPADHIFVGTNEGYVDTVREQLPNVPPENIIGEPEGHGTAPSIGYAALHIQKINPDAVMISLHADHYIERASEFRRALTIAAQVAAQGYLVTLGIEPRNPETGYGYIHRGDLIENVGDQPVYRVLQFLEKPDEATATRFVESGEYYWNSGIFAWKIGTLWEEYERHQPGLCAQLRKIGKNLGTPRERSTMKRVWKQIATETIDVGIMEKSQRVAMLPISVGWSDVGSWAVAYDLHAKDVDGNVRPENSLCLDSKGNMLVGGRKYLVTIGVENLVIVETGDALLVCAREQSQKVGKAVQELERRGRKNLL
ncbi:MAG: sugar phosphate nucleotidyltransferase [Chloroflexi bacterium]|nr:sugar phosphate nucleotidyltransferase [Chloroflexota bacterium]